MLKQLYYFQTKMREIYLQIAVFTVQIIIIVLKLLTYHEYTVNVIIHNFLSLSRMDMKWNYSV